MLRIRKQCLSWVGLALAFTLMPTSSIRSMADETVKVFFLVGQSNMEGKGNPIHLDTYRDDPLISPTYASLKDGEKWRVRDDVWITYPSKSARAGGPKHGPLTVGYGTKGEESIGPEFGFGHAIGNALEEPVLIIKIAWGGKSLAVDFRPPSMPPTDQEVAEMLEKARKKNPQTTEAETRDKFGFYYREMIRHANEELRDIESKFPELEGKPVEIAGFVWHQGFNDKVNRAQKTEQYASYTKRLTAFIQDVRKDIGQDMPFVIGELSTGGIPARDSFQVAQANTVKQFEGDVVFVPTAEFYDTAAHELYEKGYWKGTDEQKAEWQRVGNDRPYHYLGSGKTYYLKGVAFADAMLAISR